MDTVTDIVGLSSPELRVWRDDGCICLKTLNAHGDPVELADDEAVALAHALLRLAGHSP